jgi:phage terminase large subunit-like protein
MPFSEAHANHAINFIQQLKLTKGKWAGKPFILLPWERDLVSRLFGTLREDGTRQYRTAYVEIGKKNGKSELGAAIALYMLLADGEPNAEVYVAACDRQQASIIFNTSMNFVEGNRTLSKVTNTIRSTKRIVYPKTGSFYQVLSSDVKSKSGINASCVILDEIWTYPNPDLAKMLTTGSGDARTQPLFLYLTTAGNKLSGYGWEMHCKAKDILEGRKVDPTFLSIIYGLEDDADIEDENNWYKANPSLGHTISIDRVREHYNQVKDDPADLALFKQLRLNMWLKQEIKWMPMDKWDLCNFNVDPEELKGRVCYGGLDLSSTSDITAFVLVFPPEDEEDKYQVLPFFWLPEETLPQRVKRDSVPYDIWNRQGLLNLTEGNVVHTIRPWLVRIEQAMNRKLFKESEKGNYFVSFNASALMRGDYKSRMDGYSIGIQNGFFSVNDVRRMENLDPISAEEGGDLYLTNGNMLPLKMAGAYAKKALKESESSEGEVEEN